LPVAPFCNSLAYGSGGAGLAAPTDEASAAERWTGVLKQRHVPIKARRIIHLCMAGGPSHLETFDWKPKLKELDGKAFPESFTKGQQLAQLQGAELKARGAICGFTKRGQSGLEISEPLPAHRQRGR